MYTYVGQSWDCERDVCPVGIFENLISNEESLASESQALLKS